MTFPIDPQRTVVAQGLHPFIVCRTESGKPVFGLLVDTSNKFIGSSVPVVFPEDENFKSWYERNYKKFMLINLDSSDALHGLHRAKDALEKLRTSPCFEENNYSLSIEQMAAAYKLPRAIVKKIIELFSHGKVGVCACGNGLDNSDELDRGECDRCFTSEVHDTEWMIINNKCPNCGSFLNRWHGCEECYQSYDDIFKAAYNKIAHKND